MNSREQKNYSYIDGNGEKKYLDIEDFRKDLKLVIDYQSSDSKPQYAKEALKKVISVLCPAFTDLIKSPHHSDKWINSIYSKLPDLSAKDISSFPENDSAPNFVRLVTEKAVIETICALAHPNEDRTKAEKLLRDTLPDKFKFLDSTCFNKIFSLLDDDVTPYLSHINKKEACEQIIETLINPTIIYQGSNNLCGVDVYIRFLLHHFPEKFIEAACNIYTTGKTDIPISIKLGTDNSSKRSKSLITAMLEAVKNTENHLGYYQDRPFDEFFGSTFPAEIFKWIIQSGGIVEYESCQIIDKEFQEFSALWRQFWGKKGHFYSEIHTYTRNTEQEINYLQQAFKDNKFCIGLISSPMAQLCLNQNEMIDEEHLNGITPTTLLGGQLGHYIHVTGIETKERVKYLPQEHSYSVASKQGYPIMDDESGYSYQFLAINRAWKFVVYQGKNKINEYSLEELPKDLENLKPYFKNREIPKGTYKPSSKNTYKTYGDYDNLREVISNEMKKALGETISTYHDKTINSSAKYAPTNVTEGVILDIETRGKHYKAHLTKEAFAKHFRGFMIVSSPPKHSLALKKQEQDQAEIEDNGKAKRDVEAMKTLLNSKKVNDCCTTPEETQALEKLKNIIDNKNENKNKNDDKDQPRFIMQRFIKEVQEKKENLPIKIVKLIFCILWPPLLFFGNPLKTTVYDQVAKGEMYKFTRKEYTKALVKI